MIHTSYYVLLSQTCSVHLRSRLRPCNNLLSFKCSDKSEAHFFHLLISRVQIGAVFMHDGAEINSF